MKNGEKTNEVESYSLCISPWDGKKKKQTWFEKVYEPSGSLEINVFKGRYTYIYIYAYIDYTYQEMFARLLVC